MTDKPRTDDGQPSPQQGSSRRKRYLAHTLMLAIAPAVLTACNMSGPGAESSEESGPSYDQSTKLTAYYMIAVALDLPKEKHDFEEENIANAKPTDSIYVRAGSIEGALADLKNAREMSGDLGPIDQLADTLIARLDQLVTRTKSLSSYFTMRAYLDDKFARAKRENPLVIADYDAAMAAAAPFAAQVEKAHAAQDDALLPRLKAEGRMGSYYDILIARQARAFAHVTSDETFLDDTAKAAKADQITSALMPLLERARAARAAEARQGEENSTLDSGVLNAAEEMVGSYRKYRQSKKPEDRSRIQEAIKNVLLSAR